MRIVFPRRKVLLWTLALLVAVVVGGVWFAYAYVTDSRTLAALIRAAGPALPAGDAARPGPGPRPAVRGRGQPEPRLRPPDDRRRELPGHPHPLAAHPARRPGDAQGQVRAARGGGDPSDAPALPAQDGTWNLQGLLADPWPGPTLADPPTIFVQNGTVELCDDDPNGAGVAILRDVSLRVVPAGSGSLKFEGTAKGDAFDRLSLQGTFDPASGRVELGGDLARLEISKSLRARLPAEYRDDFDRVGLTAGEVDVWLGELVYDPAASPKLRYNASSRLRSGLWNCRPTLPFPINDLAASLSILDGVVSVDRAEGYNGTTRVRADGTFSLGDPERAPMDMQIDVVDLEFDDRLRAWTPPEFAKLWDEYQPKGRVNVGVHAVRDREGGPIGFGMGVDCRDVAMTFDKFPYPVSQVNGRLTWEKGRIHVNLKTSVNGKPLTAKGTIDNPGARPHVQLEFRAESLPIDKTLIEALPADVRKVVKEFQPTGTVRGVARAEWVPPKDPRDDPSKGRLTIDADIDLDERCSIKWVELPYPVENLTGRLSIHPDKWIIKNMRGINGQAVITASGEVEADAQKRLSVDLKMQAQKLLFDQRLRDALPPAWQKSWSTLNPIGSSDVDATIKIRPGQPDSYHLELTPQQETGILLKVDRTARPGPEALPPLELRMDDVTGRFVFDNGTVSMQDVGFLFHGSPVRFARGQVQVQDSGAVQAGRRGALGREAPPRRRPAQDHAAGDGAVGRPARRRQSVHDQGQPRPRLVGPGRPARLVPLGPRPGDLQQQLDPGRPGAEEHAGADRSRPRVLRRRGLRGPRRAESRQRQRHGPADHEVRIPAPRREGPRRARGHPGLAAGRDDLGPGRAQPRRHPRSTPRRSSCRGPTSSATPRPSRASNRSAACSPAGSP